MLEFPHRFPHLVCCNRSNQEHHRGSLLIGPLEAASAYQQVKLKTYRDIDRKKYDFLPFVVETHGAFGKAAAKFCKKFHSKRMDKLCL